MVLGDIADADAVQRAAAGAAAVVHLAAHPDDAPFLETLLAPNVVGLFNVMDAARRAGASRVVLASSMQVVSGLRRRGLGRPLTADDAAPTNHYALTKVWAERMGEMYARVYGLPVIAARIGWLPRSAAGADRLASHRGGPRAYLSHGDAGRFFADAVDAAFTGFAVLYAVSRPPDDPGGGPGQPAVDLDTARRMIGYEPRDVWPAGLAFEWSPAHGEETPQTR